MKNSNLLPHLFVALVAAALLGGCAIAPPAALTPEGTKMAVNKQLIEQLRTPPVDPEKQTQNAETAEILLTVTLERTLANFDYLQPLKSKPAHQVGAKVEHIEIPMFGLNLTVPLRVRYTIRTSGDAALYEKVIESSGTAKFEEAFVGARRVGIAVQRAVSNSVDLFMKELSTLSIPPAKP